MQTISNSVKWHSKEVAGFVEKIFNFERILMRISQQWRGQSKETKNRHATPPPQHIRFNPLTHPLYSTIIRIPRPLQTCITRHRHWHILHLGSNVHCGGVFMPGACHLFTAHHSYTICPNFRRVGGVEAHPNKQTTCDKHFRVVLCLPQ